MNSSEPARFWSTYSVPSAARRSSRPRWNSSSSANAVSFRECTGSARASPVSWSCWTSEPGTDHRRFGLLSEHAERGVDRWCLVAEGAVPSAVVVSCFQSAMTTRDPRFLDVAPGQDHPQSSRGCQPTAVIAGWRDCVGKRWTCWPESVWTITRGLSGEPVWRFGRVLEQLARALQLDEAERLHLFFLERTASRSTATASGGRRSASRLRPMVQRLLDAMTIGAGACAQWPSRRARSQCARTGGVRADL